jgi:hypothetical protein
VEQTQRIAGADHLADELQADRRDEQHDLPVDLHFAQHAPHVPRHAEDHKRRKIPDVFLRTGLAKAAAREAAADREERRAVLAHGKRRQRHRQTDDRAGVGTCDQPREQCAFEREIRGVVVEEHAGAHPGGERHGKAQGEDQAVRPVALFENQNVAETAIPCQHRREGCHRGQLDDQRDQEKLTRREEFGLLKHRDQRSGIRDREMR